MNLWDENENERFSIAMLWLAEKYPTLVQGETTARILTLPWLGDYFEAMSDISIERVEAGIKWHYAHNDFFPEHPAALRKSIESMPIVRGKIISDPLSEIGYQDSPQTSHEAAAKILEEIFNRIEVSPQTEITA